VRVVQTMVALATITLSGDSQLQAQATAASKDSAALVVLNQGYIDSFMKGNSAWYDAHLTPDYLCFTGDGSIISRADFLKNTSTPMTYKAFAVDSVRVQLVAPDVALVSAITPFERADGTRGVSRYTDTWVRRDGTWKAVRAQIVGIRGR
jgi:hypothetical protein